MKVLQEIKQTALETYRTIKVRKHFDDYIEGRKKLADRKNLKYTLSSKQLKEYTDYYRSFGFKNVETAQIKLIYAVTGRFDKRIIPNDIFNLYIDPVYPNIRDFWQNKSYQKQIMPGVRFPNTIVRNVNGYFIDKDDSIISEEKAMELIRQYKRVVVKPTIFTGGGVNVRFFDGNEVDREIFEMYGKDFLVQEKIKQGSFMAGIHDNAVCTDKILSFMRDGKVYILCSFLRIGGRGAESDNLTSNPGGCLVWINDDGRLNDFGLDPHMNRIYSLPSGRAFSDITVEYHQKCVEIIKKAHLHLLHFPVVSWDFAQGEDGEPILIEYNMKWHELLDGQLYRPAFTDMTEDVLREAAKKPEWGKP